MQRRQFLKQIGATGLVAVTPHLALANAGTESRLVLVILRGALDGLAAVPPYGDPHYARQRGELALATPGRNGGVLDLDGFFGLHPRLANFHKLYTRKELAVVHAVASPYRERSHFDGQDVLENGTGSAGTRDGWLNRALGALSASSGDVGLAMGQTVPLVLRGAQDVNTWAPSRLPETDDDTLERIAWMYDGDEFFADRLQQALAADALANTGRMTGGGRNGRQFLTDLVRAAGKFLAAADGPRVAVLDYSGWDTHANQGTTAGALANRLEILDEGLATLEASLGDAWQHSAVLIVTEFGRTVAVNGTRGTDHGTASCAFVAGGAVQGGEVMTDWPGLQQTALYDGRDLQPTTDLRALFKGVLRDHLKIPRSQLDTDIFPNSHGATALPHLIRT